MFVVILCLLVNAVLPSTSVTTINSQQRVFEIDYKHDQFLKDGEPFRYVSGSLHYFRVPRAYWRDRLRKYKAAGLNAVCTYIEWNFHEPLEGKYEFSGEQDFEYFVKLAQEEGLLVILRPGPYICAERDFGGYPPWLLSKNPEMGLRTNESSHTHYVYSWLKVLLPKIQPLLYGNGGPVIMVQVENEYGSYVVCDRDYTKWLRDVFRDYVGDKAVLFTTDGNDSGFLKCGPIPGVFTTVDFGAVSNVTNAFQPLREIQKHGPLVNSEFYPGWLTHWGENESKVDTDSIVKTTRQLLTLNASFNFYMFHGGTNFGFSSGANYPPFKPQLTSYDYDAPISESGNLTEKYYAIRSVIAEFLPVEDIKTDNAATSEYGTVILDPKISLFDSGTGISYGEFEYPKTFEYVELYSGFMLYETTLPSDYPTLPLLEAKNVRDRTIVYVNKEPAVVFSRSTKTYSAFISAKSGDSLALLVENEGHINFLNMSDAKGLINNVTLAGNILVNWKHTGYPLTNVFHIADQPRGKSVALPAFYSGNFNFPLGLEEYNSTFVDMRGWGKGILWVNGHNLGRYWPELGPQITLYLPGSFLRQVNTILLLELEKVQPDRSVKLVAEPIYNNHREDPYLNEISVQIVN